MERTKIIIQYILLDVTVTSFKWQLNRNKLLGTPKAEKNVK